MVAELWGIPYSDFVKQTERVFFAGMKRGYAFGFKGEPHPRMPGWKRICNVIEGCWLIIDEWCDKGGRTIILYEPIRAIIRLDCCVPIWNMCYSGHYEKHAIPFLKEVLAKKYAAEEFCGGRGPALEGMAGIDTKSPAYLRYQNTWSGTFMDFTSNESIDCPAIATVIGNHSCRGGMLV